jgi:hypothetical protein
MKVSLTSELEANVEVSTIDEEAKELISVLDTIEDRTLEAMEEDSTNEMDSVTVADEAIDEDTLLEETANEVLAMIVDDGTVSLEMVDDSEVRLTRLVANVDETITEELSSADVDTDEDSRVSETDVDTDDAGRTVELSTTVDDATDENSLAVMLGTTEDV